MTGIRCLAKSLPPHRPWWKVAVNVVLRAIQPQRRKWVIYSVFEFADDGGPARLVGYGFGRVKHRPRWRWTDEFYADARRPA